MKRLFLAGFLAGSLGLFGIGCSGPSSPGAPLTVEDLNKRPPQEITESLQFIPGDTFELKQSALGLGQTSAGASKKMVKREVLVTRFAATNFADVSWTSFLDGTTVSGTVSNINLSRSHSLYPPAFWSKKTLDLIKEKTGLWLSDDAYLELSRTKQTVLNIGVFDEAGSAMVRNNKDLKATNDVLRAKAAEDGKRADLTLVRADDELIEWPLKVNGKDIKVKAIKARNWFGEMIVMANRQNPIVLKFTLYPLFAGADEAIKVDDPLKSLYDYEITSMNFASIK